VREAAQVSEQAIGLHEEIAHLERVLASLDLAAVAHPRALAVHTVALLAREDLQRKREALAELGPMAAAFGLPADVAEPIDGPEDVAIELEERPPQVEALARSAASRQVATPQGSGASSPRPLMDRIASGRDRSQVTVEAPALARRLRWGGDSPGAARA
jgi:hypothetical protein